MIPLILLFVVYVIASGLYIRKLHACVRTHEVAWEQIHTLTDHNQEGDIIIHAHKVPEDVVVPIHRDADDENEMERLLEQRDKLNEEITALAYLMRLSR
jgi:hypothetical protein